jgi:hypothetical protein
MNAQPITLPAIPGLSRADIERAQFPALYVAARAALLVCVRVDECKDLQDKYEALARYAKQAQNEQLVALARKIGLRAERRMGEILDALPKSKGGQSNRGKGTYPYAKSIGLSAHRVTRALFISRMDEQMFELHVESEHPPGREELAQIARSKGPGTAWSGQRATLTALKNFARFWETHPPEAQDFTDPRAHAEARALLLKCEEAVRALAHILAGEGGLT